MTAVKPPTAEEAPAAIHKWFEAKRAEVEGKGLAWDGRLDGKTEEEYLQRYLSFLGQKQVSSHSELGGAKPAGPSGKDLIGDAKPAQGKVEKWVDDTVGDPHRKVNKALGADRSLDDVKGAAKGLKDAAKKGYSDKPKDTQSALLTLAKLAFAVYLSSHTTVDKLSELEGWTQAVVAGALGDTPPGAAGRRSTDGTETAYNSGVEQGTPVGQAPERQDKIKAAVKQHGRGAVLTAIWKQVLENAKFADGDSPNIRASANSWTW